MISNAIASSTAEIGWVTNTEESPWLIDSARRNCCFGERAEDQADDAGRHREIEAPHEEADDAERGTADRGRRSNC